MTPKQLKALSYGYYLRQLMCCVNMLYGLRYNMKFVPFNETDKNFVKAIEAINSLIEITRDYSAQTAKKNAEERLKLKELKIIKRSEAKK